MLRLVAEQGLGGQLVERDAVAGLLSKAGGGIKIVLLLSAE